MSSIPADEANLLKKQKFLYMLASLKLTAWYSFPLYKRKKKSSNNTLDSSITDREAYTERLSLKVWLNLWETVVEKAALSNRSANTGIPLLSNWSSLKEFSLESIVLEDLEFFLLFVGRDTVLDTRRQSFQVKINKIKYLKTLQTDF